MKWEKDTDIQDQLNEIVEMIEFSHIQTDRVFAYRTYGSTARAYARIWCFPKIFQEVLDEKPAYVIEVISEKFDKLKDKDKQKVLIHELLHIPKNFSGSLLPHKFGNKQIDKEVERLYKMMEENN